MKIKECSSKSQTFHNENVAKLSNLVKKNQPLIVRDIGKKLGSVRILCMQYYERKIHKMVDPNFCQQIRNGSVFRFQI